MSNLSTKFAILHHQYFQFLHIMHEYLPEASRKHVLSLPVASITNCRHEILTLETPTNSVVNTLRFPPWLLQFLVTVTLMADKMFCSLFHNGWSVYRTNSHRESNPRIWKMSILLLPYKTLKKIVLLYRLQCRSEIWSSHMNYQDLLLLILQFSTTTHSTALICDLYFQYKSDCCTSVCICLHLDEAVLGWYLTHTCIKLNRHILC